MIRLATLLVLALVVPADGVAQPEVVRFARLWDSARTIEDVVVTIDGTRIVAVGSGERAVPRGVPVVDLRPYVGLPGLIDLHTHTTYYWDRQPGTRPLGQRRRAAETVFLAQEDPRLTLESGVTTCGIWGHRTRRISRCAT